MLNTVLAHIGHDHGAHHVLDHVVILLAVCVLLFLVVRTRAESRHGR